MGRKEGVEKQCAEGGLEQSGLAKAVLFFMH